MDQLPNQTCMSSPVVSRASSELLDNIITWDFVIASNFIPGSQEHSTLSDIQVRGNFDNFSTAKTVTKLRQTELPVYLAVLSCSCSDSDWRQTGTGLLWLRRILVFINQIVKPV